ncbi:MAG: hypothetical protein K9L86_05750 [Candidatus Omnitrophica bacterium]|nr:hypothetical protein [Candidatus Omnitrophota bacterium]
MFWIWIMIIMIVMAAGVVTLALLPTSKELAYLEKLRKIADDLLYRLKNTLREAWKEKKKLPLPLVILGAVWILNGLYISISTLMTPSQITKLETLAGIFRILSIGWIIIGVTLFNGYILSRKFAFIAAGIVISLGIAVIAVPPLTQEEYLLQQYEIYLQNQQYQQNTLGINEYVTSRLVDPGEGRPTKAEITKEQAIAIINMLIALITILYLITPKAKKYFGIEKEQSFSFKEGIGSSFRRYR